MLPLSRRRLTRRTTSSYALLHCTVAAAFSLLTPAMGAIPAQTATWPVTEGLPGGGRYSPLADINTANVDQLEQAWVYRYGADDYFNGSFPFDRGTSSETTPILVGDRLSWRWRARRARLSKGRLRDRPGPAEVHSGPICRTLWGRPALVRV
ncbi:MAG TPA: hypothetical protein VFX38_06815 [Gammaproteobacteria bacterium]|nr:hypothetical protein [Gammaproteobacteria bacterium]